MLQDLQSGFTHYYHFFGHCGTLWGQNGNFSRLRFSNSPLVKTICVLGYRYFFGPVNLHLTAQA